MDPQEFIFMDPEKLISPRHIFTYNGAQLNVYHANKGEGLPKHQHVYSHATVCCSGSLFVRKEGIEKVMTKNSKPINLVANEWHELEAAEDNTVFINIYGEGKLG